MDIHPPDGPTHSFKDFAIHILIVTIGILIALGLEGVRETLRERKAVSEARESFQQELQLDQRQLRFELANIQQVSRQLKQVIEHFPQLAKTPTELTNEAVKISPSFYFFRTTAWESAVASGVLAHMSHEEVSRFSDVYLSIRNYQDAQKGTIPDWISEQSYFGSHHTLDPAGQVTGEEKLRSFQAKIGIMQHLGEEFAASLKDTVGSGKSVGDTN